MGSDAKEAALAIVRLPGLIVPVGGVGVTGIVCETAVGGVGGVGGVGIAGCAGGAAGGVDDPLDPHAASAIKDDARIIRLLFIGFTPYFYGKQVTYLHRYSQGGKNSALYQRL